MSTQNQHIAKTLREANKATRKLIEMGLTVLDVHIGDAMPRIEIQPGHGCRQLESAISITHGTQRGTREVTKTARLDGAYVEWREPA